MQRTFPSNDEIQITKQIFRTPMSPSPKNSGNTEKSEMNPEHPSLQDHTFTSSLHHYNIIIIAQKESHVNTRIMISNATKAMPRESLIFYSLYTSNLQKSTENLLDFRYIAPKRSFPAVSSNPSTPQA